MYKKISFVISFLLILTILFSMSPFGAYANYSTDMNASTQFGQSSITGANQNNGPGVTAGGFDRTTGVVTIGSKLVVADYNNNRVLIFNSIPTSNNASANVVIGQPDFVSNARNQGNANPAANTLNRPIEVATDGTKLFIVDSFNNRVLIYNSLPTSNNASANVVIGQADFTHGSSNQGNANPDATTLNDPYGIFSDGTKLYVSDNNNSRILIYNSIPTSNDAAADVVVGQSSMTTISGTCNASRVSFPEGIFVTGGKLIVGDFGNLRVLIYNSVPTSNGVAADVVMGATDMTTCNGTEGGASGGLRPSDIYSDGTNLMVSDDSQSAVLVHNTIPTSSGAPAPDFLIGQVAQGLGCNGNSASQDFMATASSVCGPGAMTESGGKFILSDQSNSRVLIFNSIPTSNDPAADVEIGHVDFIGESADGADTNAIGLRSPEGVLVVGTKLIISDCGNNRILIWNNIPTSMGTPADVVLGQTNFENNLPNQGVISPFSNAASASTLSCPEGLGTDGTKLFVADASNDRILIYNTIPTTNDAPANVEIGHTDMTGSSNSFSVTSQDLLAPSNVSYDASSGKLVVSDYSDCRVLIYNSVPTSDHAAADVEVGEPDMNSSNCITDNADTAQVNGARIINNKLVIADTGNNRVLIYNSVPTANAAIANIEIGQPDMNSGSRNRGSFSTSAQNSFWSPSDVFSDGTKLFVQDSQNNRVLIFNTIPTSSDPNADIALGQPDFVSNTCNQNGNALAKTLCTDGTTFAAEGNNGLFATNNGLYAIDSENNRVVYYSATTAGSPSLSSPTQSKVDCTTSIPAGGFTTSSSVCLGASVTDTTGSDTLTLQVEVEPSGIAFTNSPTASSSGIAFSGSPVTVSVGVNGLTPDQGYHWQARVEDSENALSAWTQFGNVADFYAGSPPNNPTSLGPSTLVQAGYISSSTPTFTYTVSDNDVGDTVRYHIQVASNNAFSSIVIDYTSALASQGATSFMVGQASGGGSYTTGSSGQTLADGSYYWRVLAIDAAGHASSYSVANNGSVAFVVDTTAPTVPGEPMTTSPSSTQTPSWSWAASSDSGSGVKTYTVQWCQASDFSNCNGNTASTVLATYAMASPLENGVWYMRANAQDNEGNISGYSLIGTVIIAAVNPTVSPTPTISITPTPSISSTPTPSPTGITILTTSPTPTPTNGLGNTTLSTISDISRNQTTQFALLAGALMILSFSTPITSGPTVTLFGSAFFSSISYLNDIPLLILRNILSFVEIFRRKKKINPWGVVFDSLTKQPVDPVIVKLIPLDGKGETQIRITDFDGRFGFLVQPGKYRLEITKQGYSFPSKVLSGRSSDEDRNNLYFGGELEFTNPDLVEVNIPIDPVAFNWNQAHKPVQYEQSSMRLGNIIADTFFVLGFLLSLLFFVVYPVLLNMVFLLLYPLSLALSLLYRHEKKWGVVYDHKTRMVESLVNVRALRQVEGLDREVSDGACTTDQFGRYYLLLNTGKHKLVVEKKNEAGNIEVLRTVEGFDVKANKDIINPDIEV